MKKFAYVVISLIMSLILTIVCVLVIDIYFFNTLHEITLGDLVFIALLYIVILGCFVLATPNFKKNKDTSSISRKRLQGVVVYQKGKVGRSNKVFIINDTGQHDITDVFSDLNERTVTIQVWVTHEI